MNTVHYSIVNYHEHDP